MATTVVNIRGRHRENGGQCPPGVVYIGPKVNTGGWRLPASPWACLWLPYLDGSHGHAHVDAGSRQPPVVTWGPM